MYINIYRQISEEWNPSGNINPDGNISKEFSFRQVIIMYFSIDINNCMNSLIHTRVPTMHYLTELGTGC
jgi:hypothetical protein